MIGTGVKEFEIGIKNKPRRDWLFTMGTGQKLKSLSVKLVGLLRGDRDEVIRSNPGEEIIRLY